SGVLLFHGRCRFAASRPYIQRRVEFDLGPPTNSIPQGQTAATPATNMDLNDLDSTRKSADATVAPRASRLPTTRSSGNTFARDIAQAEFSSGQSQARWSGSSRISWKTVASRGAVMSDKSSTTYTAKLGDLTIPDFLQREAQA